MRLKADLVHNYKKNFADKAVEIMANFCGKCGTRLDERTGLCPNCDSSPINEREDATAELRSDSENNNQTEAVFQDNTYQSEQKVQKPKKKSRKAIKITAIILAAVIVVSGALCVLNCFNIVKIPIIDTVLNSVGLSNNTPKTTESPAVIKNGNGEFYIGSYPTVKMESDGSLKPIKYAPEEKRLSLSSEKSAYDGKYIYAQNGDDLSQLYKFELNSDGTASKTVWVDEATLKNSVVVTEKKQSNGRYTGTMRCFQADGDYIYFLCIPSNEFWNEELCLSFRMGRIKKDGTSIEFIGNTRASSFAVKNGWIYFFDNGYSEINSKKTLLDQEIDYARAGIYKMKTDGSQKQLLLGGFTQNKDYDKNNLCNNLTIAGEYIYYLDCSENGKSRVARIKTDGSDRTYITQGSACSYTLDTDNNKLYYISGEYEKTSLEKRNVYEVSITDNSEIELFEVISNETEFRYSDGYLYFMNTGNYYIGDSSKAALTCGKRYNLAKRITEDLKGYVEYTTEYNELGMPSKVFVGEDYYWKAAE